MPDLLVEIGCEELPAAACRQAEAQLPGLLEAELAPGRARCRPSGASTSRPGVWP